MNAIILAIIIIVSIIFSVPLILGAVFILINLIMVFEALLDNYKRRK